MNIIAVIVILLSVSTQTPTQCKSFEAPVQAEDGSWIQCPSEYWSDVPPAAPAPKPSFDRYQ